MHQRLAADGSVDRPAFTVSDGTTDDQLNDISGDRIVYTTYDVGTFNAQVMAYFIDAGTGAENPRALLEEASIAWEVQIDGDGQGSGL